MSLEEFARLVQEMRTAQSAWFRGDKSTATLDRAKRLERQVDTAAREILEPQKSLF